MNVVYLPGLEPEVERSEVPCGSCGRDDREVNWSIELRMSVCLACYLRRAEGVKADEW